MANGTGQVFPVSIEDEVKESYLNYAMSVIVSRALPDVRDGLKPVHRRILYSMSEMGLHWNTPYRKCGRIVGDVLGKFHPHGDQSIYDALVRLAQTFSMRYPVVNGQGNFGSIDGDPPAAMRYTEARLQKISESMLSDIKKETVDFGPNYDDSINEPLVLPGAFPYLLANGGSGIAVGMATNIPPHNLREITQAVSALIENPDLSSEDLAQYLTGPDFPTGGIIFGRQGIKDAYTTGRGRITVRARVSVEETKSGRDRIVVNEIPYMVNKKTLIVRIADLIKNKKIEGIADLRDESDRNGMRIIIELKRGVVPKVVLNLLFTHTQLQANFGVNNLALVDGRPKLLTLRDMVQAYVDHRKEVIIRRSKYDLRKAEERAHILEGLKIALENIDEVVQLIKQSSTVNEARTNLMDRFDFSEAQAQAILDMRLQKLTSLETKKIIEELEEVRKLIAYLKDLLSDEQKILKVVREELEKISDEFGDDRRTEIVPDEIDQIDIEDLIQREDMVILISNRGYIKRVAFSSYRRQGRGGKGSASAKLVEDDFLEHMFVASTHDYFLFVTSRGKAYWMKVHEIPEASRTSRGQHVKSVLSISANEEINAILTFSEFRDDRYVFMATSRGRVKKVTLSDFSNAKTRGIAALKLDGGDKLITALLTEGNNDVILVSRSGRALRVKENEVRTMGRTARGVQGIRLAREDELSGVVRVDDQTTMLLVTENGMGKRVEFDELSPHGRATGGQIAYRTSDKTGEVIGVLAVGENDDLMCITTQGQSVKLRVADISKMGRAAMGVRVVNIERPDSLVAVARAAQE